MHDYALEVQKYDYIYAGIRKMSFARGSIVPSSPENGKNQGFRDCGMFHKAHILQSEVFL